MIFFVAQCASAVVLLLCCCSRDGEERDIM